LYQQVDHPKLLAIRLAVDWIGIDSKLSLVQPPFAGACHRQHIKKSMKTAAAL
jgi:hypothetical protein